jgi:hypothetical protein
LRFVICIRILFYFLGLPPFIIPNIYVNVQIYLNKIICLMILILMYSNLFILYEYTLIKIFTVIILHLFLHS